MRIRKKIHGTAERPRMSIMVSNKHIHVQFVDDDKGLTLAAVSSVSSDVKGNNLKVAESLGIEAAKAAIGKGIKNSKEATKQQKEEPTKKLDDENNSDKAA